LGAKGELKGEALLLGLEDCGTIEGMPLL